MFFNRGPKVTPTTFRVLVVTPPYVASLNHENSYPTLVNRTDTITFTSRLTQLILSLSVRTRDSPLSYPLHLL